MPSEQLYISLVWVLRALDALVVPCSDHVVRWIISISLHLRKASIILSDEWHFNTLFTAGAIQSKQADDSILQFATAPSFISAPILILFNSHHTSYPLQLSIDTSLNPWKPTSIWCFCPFHNHFRKSSLSCHFPAIGYHYTRLKSLTLLEVDSGFQAKTCLDDWRWLQKLLNSSWHDV